MKRQIPWPPAKAVQSHYPAASLDGKIVEYTEIKQGHGPFTSIGKLKIERTTSKGRYLIYLTFNLKKDRIFEHAIPLSHEHIDALIPLKFNKDRAHFRCDRIFYT